MDCEEMEQLMLEAEAQETLDEPVRKHLVVCARCRSAWRDYEEVMASLRDMPALQPSENFAERIVARLTLQRAFRRQLLFAAVGVLLVGLGAWWFSAQLENFTVLVWRSTTWSTSHFEVPPMGLDSLTSLQFLGLPLWQFGGLLGALALGWFAIEAVELAPRRKSRR